MSVGTLVLMYVGNQGSNLVTWNQGSKIVDVCGVTLTLSGVDLVNFFPEKQKKLSMKDFIILRATVSDKQTVEGPVTDVSGSGTTFRWGRKEAQR